MNKKLKVLQISEFEKRYEVVLTGPMCDRLSIEGRAQRMAMLRMLSDTPGITDCGTMEFQKMSMSHNGMQWVVVLEAVGP